MNPGVVKTVTWLNDIGFETVDSGDGETHDCDCDRPHAYIVILTKPEKLLEDTTRLVAELKGRGLEVCPMNDDGYPCIQASFDPVDGTALIDLQNVVDKMLFKEAN